jgi:hypothetical protein
MDHHRRIGVNSLRDGVDGLTTRNNTTRDGLTTRNNTTRDGLTIRNNTTTDQMTNLHVDHKLAAKIATIKGVRSANVFLTDNNAYVAVSLDNASNKVNNLSVGRGSAYTDGMNGQYNSYRNKSIGNRGLDGTMGTGSHGIVRDMTANNLNHDGVVGSGYGSKNVQNYNATNYHNKVTPLDNEGVRYNRSSTAVNNIPTEIRKKITSIVKKQVPGIKNVYASSDPDFVERLNTYATTYGTGVNKVDNTNLVADFKKLVYRIFPMHR